MNQVRWGIIGAGRVARTFAQDIKWCENAKLVGIASRTETTAKHFALDYDVDYAYGCYESLFSDPNIDAVYIATPHNVHLEQTLAALSHGKAVLCEKPFTTSPKEAKQAIAAAQDSGCYLVEGLGSYFLPTLQKAKQWVNEGAIGTIQHIRVDFGFAKPYNAVAREYNRELAGGCLLEMGIYPIAFLHYFVPNHPYSIHTVARSAPNGVEDDVSCLFNFSDCTATMTTSFRAELTNTASIIGTEGRIDIPTFWRANECKRYVQQNCVETFKDHRQGVGFEFEITAVSKEILENRQESEVVPLASSLAFQEYIAAIKQQIISN